MGLVEKSEIPIFLTVSASESSPSLYIHNMLFGSNLVAIATILKAKFAAKVRLFSDIHKYIRKYLSFFTYFDTSAGTKKQSLVSETLYVLFYLGTNCPHLEQLHACIAAING